MTVAAALCLTLCAAALSAADAAAELDPALRSRLRGVPQAMLLRLAARGEPLALRRARAPGLRCVAVVDAEAAPLLYVCRRRGRLAGIAEALPGGAYRVIQFHANGRVARECGPGESFFDCAHFDRRGHRLGRDELIELALSQGAAPPRPETRQHGLMPPAYFAELAAQRAAGRHALAFRARWQRRACELLAMGFTQLEARGVLADELAGEPAVDAEPLASRAAHGRELAVAPAPAICAPLWGAAPPTPSGGPGPVRAERGQPGGRARLTPR